MKRSPNRLSVIRHVLISFRGVAGVASILSVLLACQLSANERPNVLFIAVDDLNSWVTHLGGHPQARTPNIDRLAARGISFERAYCAVPACEPSRAALMSGQRPWTTGCYTNGDKWMQIIPEGPFGIPGILPFDKISPLQIWIR